MDEMLVLFWLFRRGQLALRPPGMRLALNGIVVEVLARVPVSPACPFRLCPVDWTNILLGALSLASCCDS